MPLERPKRLVSLDVFRGITIAAMVLVNNPGTSPVYWPLDHAEWNGLTPTDWIFPFFLFIVGVSISISLGRSLREDTVSYGRIFRRAASIWLLGAAISILPFFQFQATDAPDAIKLAIWIAFAASLFFLLLRKYIAAAILCAAALGGIAAMNLAGYNVIAYDYGTMRIFGVLQRIAVCYLAASLIYIKTTWRGQLAISVVLLLAYWAAMTLIAVPGCEVTTMNDKACNLAAYLDRLILTEGHIWRYGKVYDPEGILSTIPAIVTTLSGVLAGTWLLRKPKEIPLASEESPSLVSDLSAPVAAAHTATSEKAAGMFFFGAVLLAAGYIWNGSFPMNKALWTSSYVLATTGLALLVLACCYWLIDLKGYRGWAKPFEIFGVNALPLFVFSGIFARMLGAFRIADDDAPITLHRAAMKYVFLPLAEPINASLAYAIAFVALWLFLMWLLYRKKIYIKV